jgi:hypothetical protein
MMIITGIGSPAKCTSRVKPGVKPGRHAIRYGMLSSWVAAACSTDPGFLPQPR